jgi:hypothetical protein
MMMKKNRSVIAIVTLLLSVFSLPAASDKLQILRHIEGLSRDFYYVNIADPDVPFKAQDIVGGEHENIYYLLAFADETFVIVLQSHEGEVAYSILDEGVTINRRPKGDVVTVQDEHTWIRLAVSAHPFAKYSLTVKKHEF